MKRFLIAGNWKMNTTLAEASILASEIKNIFALKPPTVDVLLCPPFINLVEVVNEVKDTFLRVGAQNCHNEDKGAYTGEISATMIKAVGCTDVILGHSERRKYFAESNSFINKKINAALKNDLRVILCIGETLEERQSGATFNILGAQLFECLNGLSDSQFSGIVVAYEPVWAIGTGIAATLEQIDEAHVFIRNELKEINPLHGCETLILYGGSVDDTNAEDILNIKEVAGALIGGASLKAEKFSKIIEFAEAINIK
jgi:triosephosphate isomerase (TIM)